MSDHKRRPESEYGRGTAADRANHLLRIAKDRFELEFAPRLEAFSSGQVSDLSLYLLTNEDSAKFPDPILFHNSSQFDDLPDKDKRQARLIMIYNSSSGVYLDVELKPVPARDFHEQIKADPSFENRHTINLKQDKEGPLFGGVPVDVAELVDGAFHAKPTAFERMEKIVRYLETAPFITKS